jgi:hypothetical protein
MLINRASWSVFRAALGHERAGAVNGSGIRGGPVLDVGSAAAGRLQISGGAPIFDLTARTGVLAILWPLDCQQADETDPSKADGANHVVFDDASQRNIAEIA